MTYPVRHAQTIDCRLFKYGQHEYHKHKEIEDVLHEPVIIQMVVSEEQKHGSMSIKFCEHRWCAVNTHNRHLEHKITTVSYTNSPFQI